MRTPLAPDMEFTPIDPGYSKVLRSIALLWLAAEVIVFAGLAIWLDGARLWLALAGVVCAVSTFLLVVFARRRASAIGYYEGEEELLVCHGIMFRKLQVIPYGRMQQVTVNAGPLLRRQGLASVEFVTASMTATAGIPGVQVAEADRLRVDLTALGTSNLEGL